MKNSYIKIVTTSPDSSYIAFFRCGCIKLFIASQPVLLSPFLLENQDKFVLLKFCEGGLYVENAPSLIWLCRFVVIAMEAMDQLLVACHAQTLNLFVESFLRIVQKLLESTEPELKILATQSVSDVTRL